MREQSRSHAHERVVVDRGGCSEGQECVQGENRVPSERSEETGMGPGSEIPGAPEGTAAELEEKARRKFQVEETTDVRVSSWREMACRGAERRPVGKRAGVSEGTQGAGGCHPLQAEPGKPGGG